MATAYRVALRRTARGTWGVMIDEQGTKEMVSAGEVPSLAEALAAGGTFISGVNPVQITIVTEPDEAPPK